MAAKPSSHLFDEAMRIIERADEQGITLRLMGAIAIKHHCPEYRNLHETLGRELSDIDLVGYRREIEKADKLLGGLGFLKQLSVSMLIANRRIFVHSSQKCTVDIFLDKLIMCHTIDFTNRLEVDHPTIPLAEMLLSKMQIVKLTEKDVKDAIILLREHKIGEGDKETVNSKRIGDILSSDWGFYYTVTTNLQKVKNLVTTYDALSEKDKADVASKVDMLSKAIEEKPKTLGWKLRAKVGTKKIWYREV